MKTAVDSAIEHLSSLLETSGIRPEGQQRAAMLMQALQSAQEAASQAAPQATPVEAQLAALAGEVSALRLAVADVHDRVGALVDLANAAGAAGVGT